MSKFKMNKKSKILLFGCIIGLLIIVLFTIVFLSNINEYYLLAITMIVFVFFNVVFLYLQNNYQQQIVINLTNMTNVYKKRLFSIIPVAIIFLSISLISKNYFIIIALTILILLVISLLVPRRLVINSNGIRYIFRWSLKWNNVQSYRFDKENGILYIRITKNNEEKRITRINENVYSVIAENINNYLK
jgi:Ca2+/Na+ antiporter